MAAKILIIDDNAMNRKLFGFLLRKAGYEVLEAEDGKQGVEQAKEVIPDLILMDIQMPGGMDGIAALKAIRTIEAISEIPVIAVTSYTMKGDRESFLSEGFVDYISKPIDSEAFLASIKNILNDITVESPACEKEQSTARVRVGGRGAHPGKQRILCVDDEPMNLKVLDKLLVSHGYEVIRAKDGEAALQAIGENSVDLVLLDVMMPKIDGFEVCRRIKGDERYRNIPVVMITALSAKEDRIKGIEAGAEDFISKPIDQGEVLARVRMLLKMKGLNDRLNHAYEEINNITNFGEASILSFDPLNFTFLEKVGAIVNQIIRQRADAVDKPQLVIVGMPDESQSWQWYKYEYVSDTLNRTLHAVDLQLDLGEKGSSKTVFYNENDFVQSEVQPVVQTLASMSIAVSNMACYQSKALHIFAVNYGRDVTRYDTSVLNSFVVQGLFMKSLAGQLRETESAFEYTVYALARASEANDEDTGNHILRVGEYCALLAAKLNLPDDFVQRIRTDAYLHDVGKVHIHPDILKKPGKLTVEEWEIMKQHTLYGGKIIGDHARLVKAKAIAQTHHERWDGSGYPLGLKGEGIPLAGRIINLADQYDALRNARVYKPAFDHAKAYSIITEGDGRTIPGHFDPQVLAVFRENGAEFDAIYERLKD